MTFTHDLHGRRVRVVEYKPRAGETGTVRGVAYGDSGAVELLVELDGDGQLESIPIRQVRLEKEAHS